MSGIYDEGANARRVDIRPVLQASPNLLTSLVVMKLQESQSRTAIDIIASLRTITDSIAG